MGGLAWLSPVHRQAGRPGAPIPLALTLFIFAPMVVPWGVRVRAFFAWLHAMLPTSWDHRLDIWAFAANRIVEHGPARAGGSTRAEPWARLHSAAYPQRRPAAVAGAGQRSGAAMAAAFFAWILYRILRLD
ncbi:hypothetical protein ACRAWD_09815 [Caulobacter segnis]